MGCVTAIYSSKKWLRGVLYVLKWQPLNLLSFIFIKISVQELY